MVRTRGSAVRKSAAASLERRFSFCGWWRRRRSAPLRTTPVSISGKRRRRSGPETCRPPRSPLRPASSLLRGPLRPGATWASCTLRSGISISTCPRSRSCEPVSLNRASKVPRRRAIARSTRSKLHAGNARDCSCICESSRCGTRCGAMFWRVDRNWRRVVRATCRRATDARAKFLARCERVLLG
jgi:hypothetical protein